MAAAPLLAALCEETTCPICLEAFREPVTLDCGHNFCRGCLCRYWAACAPGAAAAACCPQCRELHPRREFRPNRQLANVTELARQLDEEGRRRAGGRRRSGPRELLCTGDPGCTCTACEGAQEHRDGGVVSTAEGSPRDQEKEHLRLVHLRDLMKEIEKSQGENVGGLSEEIRHLSHFIRKTEGEFQQVPTLFLQEFGSTLTRCGDRQEKQLTEHSPRLEERLSFSSQEQSALQEATEDGQVNVTLDPNTANPFLILSEDLKSVQRGRKRQCLPDTPERFDIMMCVLGQEKFTSGRHWWEVEVEENLGRWALGVARESVRRKGLLQISPDQGLWAVGQSFSYSSSPCQILAFTSPESTPLNLERKLRKIRVSLDYRKGCVEFFEANTNDLIFAFLSASFSGEGIHPFFRVWKGAKLKC